jgi:hypothetical protein
VTSVLLGDTLSDEYMTEMTTTLSAGDLSTTTIGVKCPPDSSWDRIIECWPPTSRVELHLGSIEWRIALSTGIDSYLSMGIILSLIWRLGSLTDDDTRFHWSERVVVGHRKAEKVI